MALNRDPNLPEVVPTMRFAGRFARKLNGGQQQHRQNSNDADDHEDFDKCDRSTSFRHSVRHWSLRICLESCRERLHPVRFLLELTVTEVFAVFSPALMRTVGSNWRANNGGLTTGTRP
jgi:hypothetical protein